MAVTFHRKITLRPRSVFCFGTISSVADEEGTLHRIADPPKKKSPPTNFENIGVRKDKAKTSSTPKKDRLQQARGRGPADPENSTVHLLDERIDTNRKAERNKKTGRKQVVLSVPPPSKENGKKIATTAAPFYPDVLFIGRVESPPVSDEEPTAPGEEPPQRESHRQRNRRRNIQ
jgi:hypothetical protein